MSNKTMLIVGAHSADFVWRAAGTAAVHAASGGRVVVVALSYGERGESGELWKEPGQTEEKVKAIRHSEAEKAAAALGVEFKCLDLGDYPLRISEENIDKVRDLYREVAPHIVITHSESDPFNPDHPVAYEMVRRARLLSSGAGVASAFEILPPSEFLVFEPHQPELCGFLPNTFVDITPAMEAKKEAMQAMAAQKYLQQYYAERAEHRANHARRSSGDSSIKFAEAFQRITPHVVKSL